MRNINHYLKLLLLTLLPWMVSAQVEAQTYEVVFTPTEANIGLFSNAIFNGTITNLTDQTITLTMEVSYDSLPSDWLFHLCDPYQCYPAGQAAISFILDPWETGNLQLGVTSGALASEADLMVRISDIQSSGTQTASSFHINAEGPNTVFLPLKKQVDVALYKKDNDLFVTSRYTDKIQLLLYDTMGHLVQEDFILPGGHWNSCLKNAGGYLVVCIAPDQSILLAKYIS